MNNQEWDGEGLPPVGVKCLYLNQKVFFVGVDVNGFAVLQWDGETKYTQVDYIVGNFSPIKPEPSESDLLIAKRDKAVDEMARIFDTHTLSENKRCAEKAIDAGYRKVRGLSDEEIDQRAEDTGCTTAYERGLVAGACWARDKILGKDDE